MTTPNIIYVDRELYLKWYCDLTAEILLANRSIDLEAAREEARNRLSGIRYKDDGRISEHEAA